MTLELLNIGSLWSIDGAGYIVNDASPAKIPPPYRAAVDAVVAVYREHLGPQLHSVYIRGSVPRSQAVPGVSDLDCFAVALDAPNAVDDSRLKAAAEQIIRAHPIVSDLQLEVWPHAELLVTDRFTEMAFLLKTQSACVWGEDLGPRLPHFRLNAIVANNDISQIRPDIETAIAGLHADDSAQNTRYWCRRIMKNILRAGFSLVMLDEGVFTRDLKLCYEFFARRYPAQDREMRRVLELAIQPSEDREMVLDVLNSFGAWLIATADEWLERYNPSKVVEMPLES